MKTKTAMWHTRGWINTRRRQRGPDGPDETGVSRSSGRPIAFGYTPDGRYICVVYEEIVPYTNNDFAAVSDVGLSRAPPWRLALVAVMQFRENLADRQAAEAVRARID